jgi:hypothetical protein
MMSPFPRKAFDAVRGLQTSPSPSTPKMDALHCLNGARSFWCGVDEATKDLHDVISGQSNAKILPDYTPAFRFRCASNASTSMGPSPDLDRSVSPLHCISPSPLSEFAGTPLDADAPRGCHSPSWLQARKVFVGGIPQRIEQQDLYKMFTSVGRVKKAWLQMFHQNHYANREPGAKNHRGFGFVVFSEKNTVDRMLGDDHSRFIAFDGLRLEIKRAVGKVDGAVGTPDVYSEADSMAKGDEGTVRAVTGCSPASRNTYLLTSPISAQISMHFDDYELPPVPPFPTWSSSDVPGSDNNNANQAMVLPATVPPQHIIATNFVYTSLSDVLLDGFLGQKPRNKEELERALLQALPDRYDD